MKERVSFILSIVFMSAILSSFVIANPPPNLYITEERIASAESIKILSKYRMFMGNKEDERYFVKSLMEAGGDALQNCAKEGVQKDCVVLINFFARGQPTLSSYCYSHLILGYMCEYHGDKQACYYYDIDKKTCKEFIKENKL